MDHRLLPAVIKREMKTAELPSNYEHAIAALKECVLMDEVKEWANRMAAIASYARQSKDKSLEQMAARIRLRAMRRLGELLAELPTRSPGVNSIPNERKRAAERIGMAPAEAARVVRIATIPQPMFEERIEKSPVPTITQLDPGWAASLSSKMHRELTDLNPYIELQSALSRLNEMALIKGVSAAERAKEITELGIPDEHLRGLKFSAIAISAWLDELDHHLPDV